jgi:hypothetical protein
VRPNGTPVRAPSSRPHVALGRRGHGCCARPARSTRPSSSQVSQTALASGLLVEIARYVAARAVIEIALPAELESYADPVYEMQTWWLLLGLVILAVSALIKHGVALRHEVDGVV